MVSFFVSTNLSCGSDLEETRRVDTKSPISISTNQMTRRLLEKRERERDLYAVLPFILNSKEKGA